ncbi:MAG: tyrosine--tRNA ligase [Alphaproteobacteria bacterium]
MCASHSVSSEELAQGVETMTPPGGLSDKLRIAEIENRPLVVKLGFDPTAPDLHLGHAVVLRKMRQFQDAGHKIIIIIGDFTARIGDPTGRNKTRPPLSEDEVTINAKTYLTQLSKVIDTDKVEIRFNTAWLGTMTFTDIIHLLSKTTLAQILQRDDFNRRYNAGLPISMHELLYPLMQGQDSIVINADIEMGGTDQLFNCLVGRALQEAEGKSGQVVLSMPLLVGLDGVEKMSKSKNNTIGLTEPPNDMYGKAMSIPDALLPNYLDLATAFSLQEIGAMKAGLADGTLHPMAAKKAVAHNIVRQYHNAELADAAALFFYNQFQKKDASDKSYVPVKSDDVFVENPAITLIALCSKLQPDMSKSQLRRLIAAHAVSVNGVKIEDPQAQVTAPQDTTLEIQIGKRGYFSVFP